MWPLLLGVPVDVTFVVDVLHNVVLCVIMFTLLPVLCYVL